MNIFLSLYNLLWLLILPLVRRYLRRRAQKSPAYLDHWNERFGQPLQSSQKNVIWVHAVSVGETRAAQPLIDALRHKLPDIPLLITQMTPTGRVTAQQLYPDAEVRYLPYDRPTYVRQFFADHQPLFGVLMETELWPNLVLSARAAGVPMFLANARLSEKSLKGYRRVRSLILPTVQALTGIAAQTEEDAKRLQQLGTDKICVCGNSKYDVTPPAGQLQLGEQFRQRIGQRLAVICASTREGEEALILQAWHEYEGGALLIIVPRHPERFDGIEVLVKEQGYRIQRRSDSEVVAANTQIWLGDSMGEMFAYYSVASIACIGGSLLPFGGQNLIEAAAMGVPVLFGPSMFNFQQASELALAAGAARQVGNAQELVDQTVNLLQQPEQRAQMQQAARIFSITHRGASERIADYLLESL